jgi:hypothetical protein
MVMLAVAAASCAGRGPQTGSPSAGEEQGWLAVVAFADRPEDLDALVEEGAGSLGDALVIAPVQCYPGVSAAARDRTYLLGVVGPTQADAEDEARSAGLEAIAVVPDETACVD